MFRTILCATALCASGVAASAQSTSTSNSSSMASAGNNLTLEGSNIPNNTPGLGGLVGSAGNCYPGASGQAVGPGWGVAFGGGRVDPECNVRMEMSALASILGNHAAILHACRNDESMRGTLVAMGKCRVTSAATPKSSVNGDPVVGRVSSQGSTPYTSCRMENGQLRVGVPKGATSAERSAAIKACKRDI